jgi:hypothetical protein
MQCQIISMQLSDSVLGSAEVMLGVSWYYMPWVSC